MNAHKKKKNGGSPDATELLCKEGKWNQGKLQLLLPLWQLHAECTLIFLFCFILVLIVFWIWLFFIENEEPDYLRPLNAWSLQHSGFWSLVCSDQSKMFPCPTGNNKDVSGSSLLVERIVCLSCSVPGSSTCQSILDEAQSGWMLVKRA